MEISPELVSKISERIMPEVNAWQNRPLESVYPFIFMDAIHYKVKEDHRYVTKAAYVVLGITMDGRKDILGVWIGEHESSKFWLNVLNDLYQRRFPAADAVPGIPADRQALARPLPELGHGAQSIGDHVCRPEGGLIPLH